MILVVLFTATWGGVRTATRYRVAQRSLPDWSAVPSSFNGWNGQDTVFDPIYGTDPADTNLLRLYRKGENPPVIVYVGFYGQLATILDVHSPELCYPAQGWTISLLRRPAAIRSQGDISTREAVVSKDGNRRLVVWWYYAGSRPFEPRIRYVYAMLVRSIFTGRTDGALVRIETPLEEGGEAIASARIEEFRKDFIGKLKQALP